MGSSKPWKDKEKLKELYVEKKLSCNEVADKLGSNSSTVHRWLKKYGIETRSSGEGRKIAHSKNPISFGHTINGYERWEDHSGDEVNAISVHRLLYIAHHGFEPIKNKEIHHQNEIPWDNRIENLEALTTLEHKLLHGSNDGEAKWRDKELMRELYIEDQLSTKEIGEKVECDPSTVYRWLKKHEIRVRSRSEAQTA
jgi:transposase-like protein